MIWPEPCAPRWKGAGGPAPHRLAALKVHAIALAIVEANGLNPRIAVERVSQADGRILPAREQHQCRAVIFHAEIRKPRCCKALWRTRLLVEYCIFCY